MTEDRLDFCEVCRDWTDHRTDEHEPCGVCDGKGTLPRVTMFGDPHPDVPMKRCWRCQGSGRVSGVGEGNRRLVQEQTTPRTVVAWVGEDREDGPDDWQRAAEAEAEHADEMAAYATGWQGRALKAEVERDRLNVLRGEIDRRINWLELMRVSSGGDPDEPYTGGIWYRAQLAQLRELAALAGSASKEDRDV